jgi:N-acetylmuramoyl-L-alanine amidase
LKVGEYIKKNMPGVKVVYTRDDDFFVELYKRGKIANEKGGDLFVSIHCNSTPERNSKARGFEIYLLRPGKTKDAIDIANIENSVIKYEDNPARYKELDDENYILTSMAHAAYMHHSEKFSGYLNESFKKHTNRVSRGVKQAGFYVLVGASMPNVLIELGFISNTEEENYLASQSGQEQLAKSIFEGIKAYKNYYDIANNN